MRCLSTGHSLGGAMACRYANEFADNEDKLKGVALLVSYPSDDESSIAFGGLKGLGLKVHSIWGTNDGLTTEDKIEETKSVLPDDTNNLSIVGGNHTQFYYTDKFQNDDNEADISLNDQQTKIREEMHKLLVEVSA